MSLYEFSQNELNRLLKTCTDSESLKLQKKMNDQILQIIEMFSEQGHTGLTANYAISILEKLLKYQPLSALTGEDSEWTKLEYTDDISYQNKRCPSVFKDADGKAYNTEGKVFTDDNGHTWFTSRDSRVYIEFPYNVPAEPERVYIDNSKERSDTLNKLGEIFIELGADKEIVQKMNEDTVLSTVIGLDIYAQLENAIVEKFNLKKLISPLMTDDYDRSMWHFINYVLCSDKVDEEDTQDKEE